MLNGGFGGISRKAKASSRGKSTNDLAENRGLAALRQSAEVQKAFENTSTFDCFLRVRFWPV